MKKYLFVVAHPDDEVLAAGATIHSLVKKGNEVYMCVLNSVSDIRCKDSRLMMKEMEKSHQIIGVKKTEVGNFQTMHFNTIPQIELVRFIENAIMMFQPDIVVTHHPADIHSDHQQVSIACKTAARISQRQTVRMNKISGFYYMEVMSSTDWGSTSNIVGFKPDTYMSVSNDDFEAKIQALEAYTEGAVLREPPHPRAKRSLEALAIKRGSEIGSMLAESFECVFKEGM